MIQSLAQRHRRTARLAGTAAFMMAALAASACSMFDKAPPPPCPEVSVLGDASRITKFIDGPGRDLIDVLYEGEIADAAGSCTYDVNKDTKEGKLDVEMTVVMNLSRGPADRAGKAAIRYFVAILGKDKQILNKQPFAAGVAFPQNTSKLAWTDEPIYLSIPLKAGQTGRDFQIYVGYDLSQEEVQFNRKQTRDVRP
jgi:hypothetical protein